MFQVRENDGSVEGQGLKWMVLDEDDFAWAGYDTQEAAQEAADKFQADAEARDYILAELGEIVQQAPYKFPHLSQQDVRDLIQEVADEGGY